ncbi:1-acyl-sn-glycerol-3-phosphate acyltransferase [Actinokineospora spheciospongiae]|uniref:1-acyl-sn-glycerol-3-phosphate acyltransferase n=1 Tax=Actinokineospora spheciospongiae TaxID=909613 RepID=W7IT07_9PSEU|nr:lysophospholipid acyltransferase family protein [Actinokineospora spheciospongiae]EWC64050.1 1-acyl-sn-glycerol-3-phosphate acyltransferase [Actinokineospora spheciospongiae]PWW58405.1 1-acyl-sn-glycerol-3-phosphate acyltransferase [Actinokineospora spheciospongiae]
MLYWWMKHVFLGPVLHLFFRPRIEGAENIPARGGALLASNHLAVSDSFFLPLMVDRRVTFPAKMEYFTEGGLKGRFKRWFFTGMGQIPIDRSGGSAAQAALDTGVRLLREGHLMGIYPEGTRSPDGRLYKGKTGIARIALQAGVPVIPVIMIGTDKANPIGSKMWKPTPIRIKVGKPLDFSRYEGLEGDRFVERSITDEVMYALMELSGQEYVDVYAAKAKERPAAVEIPEQGSARTVDRVPETEAG